MRSNSIVGHGALAVFAALGVIADGAAAQQRRIYIAPDDHTDYYWTANETVYRQAFVDMLDFYLDLADTTAGNPPDYRSRWACDGSFWLWEYERNRSPAQFQRLIDNIRSGHISAPMTPLVILYGGAPAETVLRGLYYSGRLERRFGLDFDLAVSMENQSHPWGISSLWAGAGAKYSWKGICGCATRVPNAGDREHDIYWATGPDGQRILMKWNSSFWGNESIGGYAEARNIAAAVGIAESPLFQSRYAFPVIGIFGRGWDDLQTFTTDFVTQAQALTTAQRRVICSNEQDFFEDFVGTQNPDLSLPTVAYSYGNEWELFCATLAEGSARVKRAVEKLRSAEALASVASLYDPSFMSGRETARDLAFMDLGLYHEHNWLYDGPASNQRLPWTRRLITEIESYVNTLHADGAAALGARIDRPAGNPNPRFFAFNPLSWARTDFADFAYAGPANVHVIDVSSGQQAPAQIVSLGGSSFLRVLAGGVPSVGYKVFEVRPGPGPQSFTDAASVTPGGGGGPGTVTVTYAVGADNRDAMSNFVGGPAHEVRVSGFSAGEPVEFVSNDSDQQTGAMEFAVDAPPGSTVLQAYVTVRAAASQSPSPTGAMAVRAYDIDDAQPFVNGLLGDLIGHHPVLPTTVNWPIASWPAGSDVQSPDVSALVQAYINRPGYAPGKHIGLVVSEGTIGAGRYVGWDDFAAPGANQARLTVVYQPPAARGGEDWLIGNSAYRVSVSPRGAITGLVDKNRAGREFAASIGGRAINDLGPSGGVVSIENAGPVSVTLRCEAPSPLQHVTRITLFRDSDRVEIRNEITQNFGTLETWGYSFNLAGPLVRHEEVGAIATARLRDDPLFPGSYATRQMRYDWLTLNHFADMSATSGAMSGFGVTLSNADCYYFRLGNSSIPALDTGTAQISPLVGGSPNDNYGVASQGGDTFFLQRFALRTHGGYDQPGAMRFALEHQNPLVIGPVSASAPRLPAGQASFFSSSNADLLLWALKPAEEGIAGAPGAQPGPGGGLVARVWNLAESARNGALQLSPRAAARAHRVTHIETNIAGGAEPVGPTGVTPTQPFARQQIRSFRLIPAPPTCPGDANGDGSVGLGDIAVIITSWNQSVPVDTLGDVDGDGFVGLSDIAVVTSNWATVCP